MTMKQSKMLSTALGWCLLCLAWHGGSALGEEAEPKRRALRFGGADDHVVAQLNAAIDADLTLEAWVSFTDESALQERMMALVGTGGALQVCRSSGRLIVDNEGGPSRGIVGGHGLNDGLWHHVLIKRYERVTYAFYVDGKSVGSCTGATPSYNALYLGVAPGKPRFSGRIDEVRLYDRCLTEVEGYDNYRGLKPAVTKGLVGWWKLDGDLADSVGGRHGRTTGAPEWVPGRGKTLRNAPRIHSRHYAAPNVISVEVDSNGMGDFPADAAWVAALQNRGGEALREQTIRPVPASLVGTVNIPANGIAPAEYRVLIQIQDADGTPIGKAATDGVTVSRQPGWAAKVKVLNNLVWELLNVAHPLRREGGKAVFTNPRDGWVHVSSTVAAALTEGDSAEVLLESVAKLQPLAVHTTATAPTLEATRYLPAGEHTLKVTLKGKAALQTLVVRAIPEIVFDEYHQNHNVLEGFAARDYGFMVETGLAAVCTTFRISGHKTPPSGYEQLRAAGKRWIEKIPIGSDPTADAAAERWLTPLTKRADWLDGVIIDEFMQYNALRTEALGKVLADPRLKGKRFYPYCCSPYPTRGGEHGVKSLRMVMEAGFCPVWERYLQEPAAANDGWPTLDLTIREEVREYWTPIRPDPMARTILTFGNLMSSPPITLNVDPSVDFRVWMDMQYHLIANDPLFFGLAGINEWTSGYADDEYLRWAAKLYRHYAIEGRRDMLSPRHGLRFELTHVENPDFAEGLRGWQVRAAATGSIQTRTFAGYSYLQGRYPRTSRGDTFLWMKRKAQAPNTVSQAIRGLVPEKAYSLKMITSDYQDLTAGTSTAKDHGVTVRIDNVTLIAGKCFSQPYTPSTYESTGSFSAQNPFWNTYHYRVFRAQEPRATLTLSDWQSDTKRSGPVAQEVILNLLELEPYLGG